MSEPKPRFGSGCAVSAKTREVRDGFSEGVEGALCGGRSTTRPSVRAVSSSASRPPGLARRNVACVPTPGAADGFPDPLDEHEASRIARSAVAILTRLPRPNEPPACVDVPG